MKSEEQEYYKINFTKLEQDVKNILFTKALVEYTEEDKIMLHVYEFLKRNEHRFDEI